MITDSDARLRPSNSTDGVVELSSFLLQDVSRPCWGPRLGMREIPGPDLFGRTDAAPSSMSSCVYPDSVRSLAVVVEDDDLLRDVYQAPGEVAGVRRVLSAVSVRPLRAP